MLTQHFWYGVWTLSRSVKLCEIPWKVQAGARVEISAISQQIFDNGQDPMKLEFCSRLPGYSTSWYMQVDTNLEILLSLIQACSRAVPGCNFVHPVTAPETYLAIYVRFRK